MISPGAGATVNRITQIGQGQEVLVNDTIDITGVAPPYPQLAYWDGKDMYASTPTYIITLPSNYHSWYTFYVDPAIFATRLGSWYKYDENIGYEPKGNNLAFIVTKGYSAQVTTKSPTTYITGTVSQIPTISTSTPQPTPTLPRWTFEKGEYAMGISILVVGLFFGLLELVRLKFQR